MTKEYIERERAVKALAHDYAYAAAALVSMLPAADVAPVVRGKWKLHKNGDGTCKQCNTRQKYIWDMDTWQRYCGACGAKMVEAEGD